MKAPEQPAHARYLHPGFAPDLGESRIALGVGVNEGFATDEVFAGERAAMPRPGGGVREFQQEEVEQREADVEGQRAAALPLAREILGHAANLGMGRKPAHATRRQAGPGEARRHLAPREREKVFQHRPLRIGPEPAMRLRRVGENRSGFERATHPVERRLARAFCHVFEHMVGIGVPVHQVVRVALLPSAKGERPAATGARRQIEKEIT